MRGLAALAAGNAQRLLWDLLVRVAAVFLLSGLSRLPLDRSAVSMLKLLLGDPNARKLKPGRSFRHRPVGRGDRASFRRRTPWQNGCLPGGLPTLEAWITSARSLTRSCRNLCGGA